MTRRRVELFSGAGGWSLGSRAAGSAQDFTIHVEWDEDACKTMEAAGFTNVVCTDVDEWVVKDAPALAGTIDHLHSSFPCQCWSTAGKRLGSDDPRNKWPATFEAICAILPTWVTLENVRGLTLHKRKAKCDQGKVPKPQDCPACYLHEVILPQLRSIYPVVQHALLDAADYGVAQRRKRWICIAGPEAVTWPKPTHAGPALAYAKWVSGMYWQDLGLEILGEPSKEEARWLRDRTYVNGFTTRLPWRTMRQVLGLVAWAPATTFSGKGDAAPEHPDRPGVQPVAGGKALGGLYGWFLRHQTPSGGTIQRPADCPSPTIPAVRTPLYIEGQRHDGGDNPFIQHGVRGSAAQFSNLRIMGGGYNPPSGQPERRTERDLTDEPSTTISVANGNAIPHVEIVMGEQIVGSPKHPDVPIDQPANALRAGGDGHDAPHYWLKDVRVVHSPQHALELIGQTSKKSRKEGGIYAPMRTPVDNPATTICAAAPEIALVEARSGEAARGHRPVPIDEAAPTMTGPTANSTRWYLEGAPAHVRLHLENSPMDASFVDTPAPTVTVTEEKGTRASAESGWVFHGGPDRASDALFMGAGRRRLEPEECAALQDFPPDHPFVGNKTSRYRQAGNAVPPRFAEVIVRAVDAADAKLKK